MSNKNKDTRIDCLLGCMMIILLSILTPFSCYISYYFALPAILCAIILGCIIAKNNDDFDKLFATYKQDIIFFSFMFFFPIITYFIFKTNENHIDLLETNKYKLEVIKDFNSNLTEEEVKTIAENIGIIDYMPLFLDYRTKKNTEFEKKEKIKREQLAIEKRQQELKKEEDKKLLDNFLSKKCNQGDKKC